MQLYKKQHLYTIFFFVSLLTNGCIKSDNKVATKCVAIIDEAEILAAYENKGDILAELNFTEPLKVKWLQNDLQILRLILEEQSPSLYRYHSKTEIDSLFNTKLCELAKPTSYLSFIGVVAEVFNYIACGHSGWSHTPQYYTYRKDSMRFFPLNIKAINQQYFIQQNGSQDQSMQMGDEILTINGATPAEINQILESRMVRDGNSGSKGKTGISRFFKMAYSNFINNPDTFKIECRHHLTKKRYTSTIAALPLSEIDSVIQLKKNNAVPIEKPLQLSIDSITSTSIYTIQSFRNEQINHFHQHFETFTDSVFKTLTDLKVKNLIIDIRQNTGGWTANGKYLFSYLISNPISYIDKVEFNKIDSSRFAPLIKIHNGVQDTMAFSLNDHKLYEWTNYPNLTVQPKLNNRFEKQVYVLIDDFSISCSAIFSALMRAHTKAIFIGSETGGAQCGSSGMVMTAQLPYTGVIANFSTAKYSCNIPDLSNSNGVIPDFHITQTINDFLNNYDTEMAFTFDLIRKGLP